jgi:hypothetical protein
MIGFIYADLSFGNWYIPFWDFSDTSISATLPFHFAASHCDGSFNTSNYVSSDEKESY